MNLFVVLSGKKLKRLAFLIVALLFAASIIMNEKENITVFSQQEPFAVYSVPTEKSVFLLRLILAGEMKDSVRSSMFLKKRK